jgi:integrase
MKDAQGEWIVISEADAAGLIEYLNPQWKLPAKILYHYGVRVSEVLGLTSENFREDYTVLVLQRLKKGLKTRQYVLPELHTQIMEIADKRAPGARALPLESGLFLEGPANGLIPQRYHSTKVRASPRVPAYVRPALGCEAGNHDQRITGNAWASHHYCEPYV